ncbi:phenylacetate--CoA ligase family protein [Frankia sp. AgKG'84/4]|uniref:phenylacetate--CoA ligase family protein n=1 Tax=Frankia sp. AgKG'84/4 TaxID=573490 RepID=UPI00200D4E7F|nr:hypothetical protein [Frankia sp. AgKG'84/4]MCL9793390.1 hypothetical protein [Frankia sp. AgKG'84/4]
MLLIRDHETVRDLEKRQQEHVDVVNAVMNGTADLAAIQNTKLVDTLTAALSSDLYRESIPADVRQTIASGSLDPDRARHEVLPALPLLGKQALSEAGQAAFTRELPDFLHYYESSGTTGEPVAAPKALDDLLVNTVNFGEMWGRFLTSSDRALILINAPFAPAAYQFEKVLEYLQVLSLRPWVDNITGDYTRILRLVDGMGVNVFVGPPSRLLEMIQFAYQNNLPVPRFDKLLLMAEQTGPAFLRHLERLTAATAYVCSYGSSETGTIAISCEHRVLHLQTQSYLLELVVGDSVEPAGITATRGELVITTLDLPARPLVRYRIGDLVEIDPSPCPCGVAQPVLRTLGRAQDVITLDGRGVRQNDFEAALWEVPAGDVTVLNYMLVLHNRTIVCLVTTTGTVDDAWSVATADRLAPLFEGYDLVVRPVEALPPLASLGQYMGWKLSRVLDVTDERNWARLREPILSQVRSTVDLVSSSVAVSTHLPVVQP